mgnify:CR=1 FL=1
MAVTSGLSVSPDLGTARSPLALSLPLILGVLLIVVGIQLFTIGLVSELIQRGRLRSEEDEAASRIERIIEG